MKIVDNKVVDLVDYYDFDVDLVYISNSWTSKQSQMKTKLSSLKLSFVVWIGGFSPPDLAKIQQWK
jgi:hypothetical protein